MAESDLRLETDLDRAAAEYASATSPFAELQNYLLEQPVFDRDPRTQASGLPTLRSLDRPEYDQEALAQQYQDLITSQREAEEAQKQEREKAIADLRTAIAEQTATAAEAAAGERSALSAALEGRIREAREAAAAEVADQGTIIGDLKERIGGLTQDLGGISQTIQEEQDKLSAELRESQAGAVDLIQGRINSLNDELAGVSQAVETETAAQSEALRGEREQIVSDLENRIGTLRDQIENLPLNEIQSQIEGITTQSQNFADTARTERERLETDLRAALTQQTDRGEKLAEQIGALQAAQLDPAQIEQQRAAAITGAIDPIQAQIEKLRGEIPQQIDVDALRKQITQEVLAGLPQPTTNVQAPAVSVGPGPGGMDPFGQGGSNVAANMNVSDGVADRMGYFERGIYDSVPTTEGAAEMGATPFLDPGIGSEMAQGAIDPTGAAFVPPQTNVQRRAVTGEPEVFQPNAAQLQAGVAPPPRFKNMPIGRIGIR
jgi:uncharacterized protein YjbJ (UPF0337 family)